ncbi:unnamed protein product [Prunus brigantina]
MSWSKKGLRQRCRRPYEGPIRIYTATKDSLRNLKIAVKLDVWHISKEKMKFFVKEQLASHLSYIVLFF